MFPLCDLSNLIRFSPIRTVAPWFSLDRGLNNALFLQQSYRKSTLTALRVFSFLFFYLSACFSSHGFVYYDETSGTAAPTSQRLVPS